VTHIGRDDVVVVVAVVVVVVVVGLLLLCSCIGVWWWQRLGLISGNCLVLHRGITLTCSTCAD
jgi:hypothetical protein